MTADVHGLTGAYAVDALPDDERAFFERHLATCEDCRREAAELRATAAALGAAAAEAPPESLRARVLAEARSTRQVPAESDDRATQARSQRGHRLLQVAAAVAALAVVGLGVLSAQLADRVADLETQLAQDQAVGDELVALLGQPDAQVTALEAPAGTQASLVHSEGAGRAVVVTDGLGDLPADLAYQLWVLRDGVPEPDRVFRPGPDGRAVVDIGQPIAGADVVAITTEPRQGSPAPTGEILIQGPVDA